MTGKKLIDLGTDRLNSAGVENARREVTFMLAKLLDCEPTGCYLIDEVTPQIQELFFGMLDRRVSGEPLQIILEEWEFYGKPIHIEKGVFIPRTETEGLVDIVIERIRRLLMPYGLEIGVGSGAISINLLAENPTLKMIGTDISEHAIELTRKNATKLNVEDRLELIRCDISEPERTGFDFVVANPPYVLPSEMENLQTEAKFDPVNALTDGESGLDTTRRIIQVSARILKPGGLIALEIHEQMGEKILEMLSSDFVHNHIIKDCFGKDRYAVAHKGESNG
jgi:release factor glutamine methyltransferase